MLTTLTRPDAGRAFVAGHDVVREANRVRRSIGSVPQESGVDREATGRENLMLQGRIQGVPRDELRRRVDELRAGMWVEVGRLAEQERLTILLTTHYLEEADRLAERVAIVSRGEIVVEGPPEELKRGLRGEAVTVELATARARRRSPSSRRSTARRRRRSTVACCARASRTAPRPCRRSCPRSRAAARAWSR